MPLRTTDVRRVRLGHFTRPAEESPTGTARVEDALGYLVRHGRGLLLLDTGIGRVDAETERWYRPVRIPLAEALDRVGCRLSEVALVVNCHLHFDHCGGNPELAGTPVICQRRELEAARQPGYTVPNLVDYTGVRYEQIDGSAELWPGITVLPTPGHVPGHQSVLVRCEDGTLVLAGQAYDSASDFAADALAVAVGAEAAGPDPVVRSWLEELLALDPRRVCFAHDASVWEPPTG